MAHNLKVAYILHRFPYLTETFIMREMYWIRAHGVEIDIFSLLSPKAIQVVQSSTLLRLTSRDLLAITEEYAAVARLLHQARAARGCRPGY